MGTLLRPILIQLFLRMGNIPARAKMGTRISSILQALDEQTKGLSDSQIDRRLNHTPEYDRNMMCMTSPLGQTSTGVDSSVLMSRHKHHHQT